MVVTFAILRRTAISIPAIGAVPILPPPMGLLAVATLGGALRPPLAILPIRAWRAIPTVGSRRAIPRGIAMTVSAMLAR
jgi:hypothetical protein